MTQSVPLWNNPAFFQSFHENILQNIHPGDDNLLVYNVWSDSFFLESKQLPFIFRLFGMIFGNSYDLQGHTEKIDDLITRKRVRMFRHLSAPDDQESSITYYNELSCSLKVAHALRKFCKYIEKKKKNRHDSRSTLFKISATQLKTVMHETTSDMCKKADISPLVLACTNNLSGFAISLIEKGASFENQSCFYDFLLDAACKKKRFSIALELIEKGSKLPSSRKDLGKILLYAFENNKSKNLIIRLIEEGADLSVTSSNQKSALHFACFNYQKELVITLLRYNANPNVQDNSGTTPLHIACTTANWEIAQLLLTYNADLTRTNVSGQTPLNILVSISSKPLFAKKAHEFFCLIFKDFGVVELCKQGEIDFFIQQSIVNPESVFSHKKNSRDINPLFLPLFLNNVDMTRAFARVLGLETYSHYLEKIEDDYPFFSSIDFLVTSLITLNTFHLTQGLENRTIPIPPQNVDLRKLLDIFSEVNFEDSSKPYYCDPTRILEDHRYNDVYSLKSLLLRAITNITYEVSFLGTPQANSPAIKEFYKIIQNALKNVISKLSSLGATDETNTLKCYVICELIKMSTHCGGRYFQTAITLYNKVCRNIVTSFKDLMYQTLADYRDIIFQSLTPQGGHNVNVYNHMMQQVGTELGIPEAHLYRSYNDPYGSAVNPQDLKVNFFKLYTAKNIQKSWVQPRLSNEADLREGFIDWHKEHVPEDWEKERFTDIKKTIQSLLELHDSKKEIEQFLKTHNIFVGKNMSYEEAIESERSSSYLETKVYSKTNQLRLWPVTSALLELKVFNFALDAQSEYSQQTIVQQMSKTVSSVVDRLSRFMGVTS